MKSRQILTLDDDPDFNSYLKNLLEKIGVAITTTTTPSEFSQELKNNPPRLCLVDLNLDIAYGAGYQMVQAIRNKMGYEIPVIVVSRRSERDDISRALEMGANDFIYKPIDEVFFTQKIKQYIEVSRGVEDLPYFRISENNWPCQFEYDLIVSRVNEFGLTLTGNYFLSKGTPLILTGEILEEILGSSGPWRFTVNSCWVDSETKRYITFLDFDFENPDIMSHIRKYLLERS